MSISRYGLNPKAESKAKFLGTSLGYVHKFLQTRVALYYVWSFTWLLWTCILPLRGVIVDEKLSWADHIHDIIIPKVLKSIRILREWQPLISTKHLVSFYQTMVLYLILIIVVLYGGNCGIVLKNKLQTLQNRATRVITRFGYEVRSSEILSSLGWCDLETLRKRQKSILMYKFRFNNPTRRHSSTRNMQRRQHSLNTSGI